MPYTYLTLAQARAALYLRLNNNTNGFWTDAELTTYLTEALRTFSALTQYWIADFTYNPSPADPEWRSLAIADTGVAYTPSPRTRTLTTNNLFTDISYALLEPSSTPAIQFTLADYTQSFARRRDTLLQAAQTRVLPIPNLTLPVGDNTLTLPDAPAQTILDILRVRYLPASPDYGPPATLFRDDTLSFEYLDPGYPTDTGAPLSWAHTTTPALTLTFDARAATPNTLSVLANVSGPISPTTAAPLYIPDDFAWVLKWGIMADLLSKESESTDLARAAYCTQRWEEGVKLLTLAPWLIQARVDNTPVDTPSLSEADSFSIGWESLTPTTFPTIVRGGIDLITTAPLPTTPNAYSISLTLAGNAPIPTAESDYLQLPRELLDPLLDYAQHLAKFKQGGAEFSNSLSLYQNFLRSSIMMNKRVQLETVFATTLRGRPREEELNPRAEEITA